MAILFLQLWGKGGLNFGAMVAICIAIDGFVLNENDELCIKMMNFVLKMMNLMQTSRRLLLRQTTWRWVKNDEFCIKYPEIVY